MSEKTYHADGSVSVTGGFKPVPDDLLTVLEHLIDAAEDVVAWYDVRSLDPIEDDFRHAVNELSDAVVKAAAFLERTP